MRPFQVSQYTTTNVIFFFHILHYMEATWIQKPLKDECLVFYDIHKYSTNLNVAIIMMLR